MTRIHSSTRREFLSTGLAVSGALALGIPGGGLVTARAEEGTRFRDSVVDLDSRRREITGPGSLKAHAGRSGLLTGAAVEAQLLATNAAVEKIVTEQYSILVAENSMKVGPMRPAPDKFSFEAGDALVAFGDAHGIKVRGHNLCWHAQLPTWFNSVATKDNAQQLLVDHIRTVAGHFKGRLQSWDVVNEAVQVSDGRPDGLRNGPWLKLLGPEFIPLAFRTAREADPNVLLTYNDYGIETDHPDDVKKRAAVLELVRGMKASNVPIDAVGIQSHIHAGWSTSDGNGLREFMRSMREMGLKIFVTEMDVNDDQIKSQDPAEIDLAVGKTYREYLDLMMQEPALAVVITWGVTDAHTWLGGGRRPNQNQQARPPQRPLPFDAQNQPTEAFYAMQQSFDTRSR